MKLTAALTREQGQEFVIVSVKGYVIGDPQAREEIIEFAEREWGVRAALIGASSHSTYGPSDIVRWLEGVLVEQLPWRDWTFTPVA